MPPKVLLFGSGAIGTVYVHLLLQSGCDVTAVCRSNYSAASQSGFTIDSKLYGKHQIHPKVVRNCTEAASSSSDPFDYVIVTTKALPQSHTPSLISPAVTPSHTTIVLIQNGIDIEPEYLSAFPSNPLLSCVVYLPTTEISPGYIEMGDNERLEVGVYPSSRTSSIPSAETFVSVLKSGGSNASFYPDVQPRRWAKLLLNSTWNPICALTLARHSAVLGATPDGTSERIVEGVMREVIDLAGKLGYGETVTWNAGKGQLDSAKRMLGGKGIEPSMLTDVLNGRRMEVEVILGNPVRIARREGVDVPRLEMLYGLVKVLDESLANRKPGESLTAEGYGEEKGTEG